MTALDTRVCWLVASLSGNYKKLMGSGLFCNRKISQSTRLLSELPASLLVERRMGGSTIQVGRKKAAEMIG